MRVAALALLLLSFAAPQDVRFESLDVFVDAGTHSLAVWQIELRDASNRIRLSGIEGGEHSAFREPAHYDPAALNRGRIILAAFRVEGDLPSGRTRVARLHYMVQGPGSPELEARLAVAADAEGRPIEAKVELQ